MQPFRFIDTRNGSLAVNSEYLFNIIGTGQLYYSDSPAPDHYIAVSAIGKVDSQGEQIYEDDVVEEVEGIFTVQWDKDLLKWWFVGTNDTYDIEDMDDFTIIGNIYQPQYKEMSRSE